MSFNRLKYDTCEQKKELNESLGPGNYQMNTPVVCSNCLQDNPRIMAQKTGVSMNGNADWRFYSGPVDVESELRNINYPASKCPSKKYMPKCDNSVVMNQGHPCGQGVVTGCVNKMKPLKSEWKRCNDNDLIDFPNCTLETEDTRLSNPSSNLRGTGINRFNPLCLDPQKNIFFPGDYQIPTRIVIKDNHRPCVPTPSINSMKPKETHTPCPKINNVCGVFTKPLYQYDVCG